MNILQTARVVIIDDEYNDVKEIIRTLGQMGIGAVYLSGEDDEMPTKPISGIRLLFLDMILNTSNETKVVMSKLAHVLEKALAPETNPLVIVVWTAHIDYIDDFKKLMQSSFNHFRPSSIITLSKENTGDINEKINKFIKSNFPLNLLWEWEQYVHDAATGTTNALSQLIEFEQDWLGAMLIILVALAYASGGKMIQDENNAIESLFTAFNPIHKDRLEHFSSKILTSSDSAQAFKDAIKKEQQRVDGEWKKEENKQKAFLEFLLSREQRGKLNRMLLLADIHEDSSYGSYPGNIYIDSTQAEEAKSFFVDKERLVDGIFCFDCKSIKRDAQKINSDKKIIVDSSIPVLVEITPQCDYVQRKVKCRRLLAGLLIKADSYSDNEDIEIRKKALYIKEIGPFYLEFDEDSLDGDYCLVIDCRYMFGSLISDITTLKASFRLRYQSLVDIQHWFASHAARPGVLSI